MNSSKDFIKYIDIAFKNPAKVDDCNVIHKIGSETRIGASLKRTRSDIHGAVVNRLIGSSSTVIVPSTTRMRTKSVVTEYLGTEINVDGIYRIRDLKYLFWIFGGVVFGISAVKIGFASFTFGDPIVLFGEGYLDCAFICSTVWMILFCATNFSLIYELIIKRVLTKDSYEAPNIPFLWIRISGSIFIAGGSCLSLWIGMYKFYGTMIPFHGIIAGAFGGVMQGFFFCIFLIPRSYYIVTPELKWKVPFGIFGIIGGLLVTPVLIYAIALVLYQLATTLQNSYYLDYLTLLMFPLTRMTLIFFLKYFVKKLFGTIADELVVMLVLCLVSILHNSFYCVSLESSSGYTAVIFSITVNTLYSIHRVLVLAYDFDLEQHASLYCQQTLGWGWSFYSSGGQRYKQCETVEEKEQNSLLLKEEDRVYYTLEFLSWEMFKFVVPLMYLASVWIITKGPNAQWMAGMGRVAFLYDHTLTNDSNLTEVTQKILILVSVDAFVFLLELSILQKLKFDVLGFVCFACREFGDCLCFLLAFMPVTQLCITAIHCGMDFSMRFKWLGRESEGQDGTMY